MPRETYESVGSPFSLIGWNLMWDNTGYAKQRMPVLQANLKAVHDAGIPVVAGTDTGVPGVLLGVSSQMELLLHVEAGLRPEDALRAATVVAARMLGLGRELGTVEPGKLADLLILDADPLADIRNVRRIHRVVKGGVARDPVELLRAGRRPNAPARR
jgi:imidazolonepropionase-like amidohydrolase